MAQDKKRVGNRLKNLLYRQGFIEPDDHPNIGKRWLAQLKQHPCDITLQHCLHLSIEQWLSLDHLLTKLDQQLAGQAKADYKIDHIFQSAPGIGPTHARIFANELEDMQHFHNSKQLFSFTGLTPREHSSGDYHRLGHISRQGRSILRKVLVQAAWIAIRCDSNLNTIFQRIANQAGKKRAIIAIACRLIGRIRACFKQNTLYAMNYSLAV